jgi:hypothetical protein
MGDNRRFDIFADFVGRNFARTLKVADIAAGNGKLQRALQARGFKDIQSWDKRPRHSRPRGSFQNHYFNFRSAPRIYELVVALHPDEGTDHAIGYAVMRRIPFVVCPCCVKPDAFPYSGNQYEGWLRHLTEIAHLSNFRTTVTSLPMAGRNIVIAGWPET